MNDTKKSAKEKLIKKIAEKTGSKGKSVKERISRKSRTQSVSSDVALVMISKQEGVPCTTFQKKLSAEEKRIISTPSHIPQTSKPAIKREGGRKKKEILVLFEYETDKHFVKGHIDEINKAYTYGCYTSVSILSRKIIENLIIDILCKKYPKEKNLYFDTDQRRLRDFGVILKNLHNKKSDFGTKIKAVERLYNLADKLKTETNNRVHSWYHLIKRKSEIDELDIPQIIELIKILEKEIGMRD